MKVKQDNTDSKQKLNIPPYKGKIKQEFLDKAIKMYNQYKNDKSKLVTRLKADNEYYTSNYEKEFDTKTNQPIPATPFIFSCIQTRFADFIDNKPAPNILEREPSDIECAKTLTQIIPVILDITDFNKTYKKDVLSKLKNGTGIFGVFYNEITDEIDIRNIDIFNIYCDMHLSDVQDSQFLFINNIVDNDILKETYPKYKALFDGDSSVETYTGWQTIYDRTVITDCYYKKTDGTLHMMKLCEKNIIDATEDTKGYENGLYSHGKYPVIFDTLYKDEESPFGFGLVDIVRNPQKYIDYLDRIIVKNATLSGEPRWFMSKSSGINKEQLLDITNNIIDVQGDIENNVKKFDIASLPGYIIDHRERKINELKEITGNREWQQGGTANGVTSGSAIQALQESGEKLSRANIDDSYDVYKSIIHMIIELIREFFNEEHVYRITNTNGKTEFKTFDNSMMYREEQKKDAFGFPVGESKFYPVDYDINIIPQKQNPYTRETNNQTLIELWKQGFLRPDNIDMSIMIIKQMSFDGKDNLLQSLSDYKKQQEQQQQAQAQQQAQIPQGKDVQQTTPKNDNMSQRPSIPSQQPSGSTTSDSASQADNPLMQMLMQQQGTQNQSTEDINPQLLQQKQALQQQGDDLVEIGSV